MSILVAMMTMNIAKNFLRCGAGRVCARRTPRGAVVTLARGKPIAAEVPMAQLSSTLHQMRKGVGSCADRHEPKRVLQMPGCEEKGEDRHYDDTAPTPRRPASTPAMAPSAIYDRIECVRKKRKRSYALPFIILRIESQELLFYSPETNGSPSVTSLLPLVS
jgi:hypothetical protein